MPTSRHCASCRRHPARGRALSRRWPTAMPARTRVAPVTCERSERWQKTGMARMLRRYRPENVIGDFSSGQAVKGRARAVLDDGRHFIEVRRGESQSWTRYPVDYTIGSKWQQAYATTLDDKRMLVFPDPVQPASTAGRSTTGGRGRAGSARADIAQFHDAPEEAIYQTTCAPCHTSQLRFANGADRPEAATFHEGGVNSETCHGPAAAHVEGVRRGRRRRARRSRRRCVSPASPPRESVAVCAQCHAQSAVHDAIDTGEVNYGVRGPWYRVYPTTWCRVFHAGRCPATAGSAPPPSSARRRAVAVLPDRRRHVRVMPRSASARPGRQSDLPQVRRRRRPDMRAVPHAVRGRT